MSKRYAIASLDEAHRYLEHPVLGPRLEECARVLIALDDQNPDVVLGSADALRLRSSMTLFALAVPYDSLWWTRHPLAYVALAQDTFSRHTAKT